MKVAEPGEVSHFLPPYVQGTESTNIHAYLAGNPRGRIPVVPLVTMLECAQARTPSVRMLHQLIKTGIPRCASVDGWASPIQTPVARRSTPVSNEHLIAPIVVRDEVGMRTDGVAPTPEVISLSRPREPVPSRRVGSQSSAH